MKNAVRLLPLVAVLLLLSGMVACSPDLSSKDTLQKVADQVNKDLPKKIDDDTELTKTEALQGILVYNYRLVNIEAGQVDNAKLESAVRPKITQGACASQEIKDTFFKNKVTLRYSYHDKDGGLIGNLDVTPANCGM